MTDVLLTHSYFLRFDPKEEKGMTPYPPLGTITAGAVLRAAGYSVALHDVMFETSEAGIEQALDRFSPRLVLLYDDNFNYLTKMCLSRMREAAQEMARIAHRRGIPVVVFSSDASDHLDLYFSSGVDIVLCGEADLTCREVCDHMLRGASGDLADIPGIAFPRHGSIVRTPPRPVIRELDTLPMAAWDLIDVEAYRTVWTSTHGYFSLNLSTTRGCPFHCNWCAKPLYGQVYNTRSPEAVVDEMLYLKNVMRVDHIWITDDIFGLTPGWVSRFADRVAAEGAVVPFKCLSRADLLMVDRTIADLKRAGCSSVWIGAESGSQKILDAMEKGTTVGQIREATARLKGHGIGVGFFLQFGYPGETWDDISRTLALVRECMPDEIGISVSYPLPGTPFYERVRSDLTRKQNWVDSQDLDLMFAGEYHPDFYRTLHQYVHTWFSIWRGVHQTRRTFAGTGPGMKRTVRSMAAALYRAPALPYLGRRLRALRRRPSPNQHDIRQVRTGS